MSDHTSDQWPDVDYVDGDFTVPAATGLPVFSSPIASTTAEYTFTQEWMQFRKNFSPEPMGSGHPSSGSGQDFSDFKLVAEGPRQDIGGGVVKWSRTYAKPPATHDEFEMYSYSFIGFLGVFLVGNQSTQTNATGRARQAITVLSRVQHDYFLTGAGQTYLTPSSIPSIKAQVYLGYTNEAQTTSLPTDYIADASASLFGSNPSRTTYETWIANAAANLWSSGVTPSGTNPGQMVAEDSRISRWMGPIFLRQTRYVLAI